MNTMQFRNDELNALKTFEDRIVGLKREYLNYLKLKANAKILRRQNLSEEDETYFKKLAFLDSIKTLHEDAKEGNQETLTLPVEMAETVGLIDKPAEGPVFLDDAIMNYKYVHDNRMPACFERSVKKLRCLLRFYGLLVKGDKALPETWEVIRKMQLAQKEEDVFPAIQKAVEEARDNIPLKEDKYNIEDFNEAAEKIADATVNLQQDREKQKKN
jgi:hypothetical protein